MRLFTASSDSEVAAAAGVPDAEGIGSNIYSGVDVPVPMNPRVGHAVTAKAGVRVAFAVPVAVADGHRDTRNSGVPVNEIDGDAVRERVTDRDTDRERLTDDEPETEGETDADTVTEPDTDADPVTEPDTDGDTDGDADT